MTFAAVSGYATARGQQQVVCVCGERSCRVERQTAFFDLREGCLIGYASVCYLIHSNELRKYGECLSLLSLSRGPGTQNSCSSREFSAPSCTSFPAPSISCFFLETNSGDHGRR